MTVAIAVANQKGGTGKTTTAVTMGHKLAMDGYDTLLIDTDTQGHLASTLGIEKQPGIYRLMQWYRTEGAEELLIVDAREALDLLPSNEQTEEAKEELIGTRYREHILTELLQHLESSYDIVVIDCAPSVDVFHVSALLAADWLIIPTRLDYLAVDGVNEVIQFLKRIRRGPYKDAGAGLLGILPTFYDRRTNETREQMKILLDAFEKAVLPPIPIDVKLREAPAFGGTIWEYAPDTRSVVGITTRDRRRYGGYARFIELVEERL